MNPLRRLISAGVPRKTIFQKTGLSQSEITMLLRDTRNASLRQRRLFFDAFGISPWEWDDGNKK